jgi:PBSX family phage terminase large subunit
MQLQGNLKRGCLTMRIDNPVAFEFQPFSRKQRKILKFWESFSPKKEVDMLIADGSIRSGKTIAMITSFVRWSNKHFSGKDFIIAGKSIGSLKRNVVNPMIQMLVTFKLPYKYNRSENYIEIGSNTYHLFGANNESSQDVLQGLTAAGAFADEIALFPISFVDQMIGRCSIPSSKIFANCNPGSPYHPIKTDFIDKAKEKNILHLHFLLDDNLTLSEEIKDRYKRMFTGVFFKRNIQGLWVIAEGVIYDMFDESIHVTDKLPDRDQKRYVGCDYGTGNPTTFLTMAEGNKKTIYHEYYYSGNETGKSKTDSQYADDLEDYYKEDGLEKTIPICVDPSAKSFITELKGRGFFVKLADNEVTDGIRFVSSEFQNENLQIHKDCKNTIKELQVYSWDPRAQLRGEDKPLKEHDHCADNIRYIYNTFIRHNYKITSGDIDLFGR